MKPNWAVEATPLGSLLFASAGPAFHRRGAMWKEDEQSPAAEESSSSTWVLWVAGWSLLVGTLLAVVPVYFLYGSRGATWAAGGVALTAALVTWLSAEAQRAVHDERRRDERAFARAERAPNAR